MAVFSPLRGGITLAQCEGCSEAAELWCSKRVSITDPIRKSEPRLPKGYSDLKIRASENAMR
jgi:hypothetical protein